MDIGTRVQRPGLPYKSFDYLVTYYPAELASEVWKAGARGAALRWGAWTHLRLETASAILQVSRVTTFLIWQVEIAERLQDLKRLDALESSLESTDYGV